MRAYLLSDGEFQTTRHKEISELLGGYLSNHGFDVEEKTIERDELAFCRGCFDCWTKTPGECIMRDGITNINRACMTSDVVVYLCPIVFGQFSANMKCVIDRWLPNVLPFFITRKDGSTTHPLRYDDYPKQIMLVYGEDFTDEEKQLFLDITQKHRTDIDIFADNGDDAAIARALDEISLCRNGGAL